MKFGDLRVYNRDFELITILPKYLSVNWEIKFSEFGLGEIELEKTNEIVHLLTENKYLFIFQDNIQAIITGYKIGETVTVFLRTLEWLLTKYTVTEFSVKNLMETEYSGTWTKSRLLEYILKTYLHEDFNVSFSGITNDESDATDFAVERLDTVYSVIKSVLDDEKYGFKFYKDVKGEKFIFSVVCAKENNDFILCDEYKTSYETEYDFDLQKEVSGGVFYQKLTDMGEWDPSTNTPELTEKPDNYAKYYRATNSGLFVGLNIYKGDILICKDRRGYFSVQKKAEPFLVVLPPADDGIFSFSGVLDAQDIKVAEEKIKQSKVLDMIRCKTGLSYGEDFELGDIIKVKFFADSMSCEKKKLISEIHMWDEPSDTGVMPTTIDIT